MVRVEDCCADMPGSIPPRHRGFFFLLNSRDLHFDKICCAETKSLCQETGKFHASVPE